MLSSPILPCGEDKDWQPGGAVNDHKSEASPCQPFYARDVFSTEVI